MLSVGRLFVRRGNSLQSLMLWRVERIASIHSLMSEITPLFSRSPPKISVSSKFLLNQVLRLSSTHTKPANVVQEQIPASQAQYNDVIKDASGSSSILSNVESSNAPSNIPSRENINLEPIPEPPLPEPVLETFTESVGGEPTFESLGLGGWSPVGIIENCFEWLHISCSLPWWTSIVIGTIVVRILMFPLVIMSQRNAAKMNNHMPQLQVLQLKMSDARERGDRLDAARYGQEMMLYMKEKQLNPLKNMMVPLAQAPLFLSFFWGLREMSNLPVESLKEGGLFWFTDLTVPDEFYLLPLITSATLAITIEVGTDAGRLQSSNLGVMKYVIRAMPVIIFPFTINFSSAILVYWASSNLISLVQVSFLKIPVVRSYFNIERMVVHDKNSLPIKDKGFVKGMKDSWTNMKLTRELEDRERADEVNFMRAGRGPIRKTYKYDPTQPLPPRSLPIQAKKRD